MTRFHSVRCWLALCILTVGGCASTVPAPVEPPLPPILPGTIARLVVDGPNAFINRSLAPSGSYVRSGDKVFTGEGTSAKLLLNDGGEIQLDENTDPLFTEGVCLLMKILNGRVAFRNLKCLEFEDGLRLAGVARSVVHILSRRYEWSRVTVLEGQVDMRSPRPATLGSLDEYVASATGAVDVRRLTPQEADAQVEWTRKYFIPRAAPPQSNGMSPGVAAGIGAAIAIIIDRLWGRDRGDRDRPESSEPLRTLPQPRTSSPRLVRPAPSPPPDSASQVESR